LTDYPAVITLIGAGLAILLQQGKIKNNFLQVKTGRQAVIIVLLMGFLSSLTVCYNLGYRKYYLPDRLVQLIQESSTAPVIIATPYRNLVQTGEMMGLAREIKKAPSIQQISFYLIPEDSLAKVQAKLQKLVDKISSPIELWAINCTDYFREGFKGKLQPLQGCEENLEKRPYINGYVYQQFRCAKSLPSELSQS